MPQAVTFTILHNRALTDTVFELTLEGDTSAVTAPGQFVNVSIPGFFLRRPISICDWNDRELILVCKRLGHGTEALSRLPVGTPLALLTGLGNGYPDPPEDRHPVLIGGGVGIPPLYGLCKACIARGQVPTVILGFNRSEEMFYREAFERLGARVLVTTLDGSVGLRGVVTDALIRLDALDTAYICACGPIPMLKALNTVMHERGIPGSFSLEARMGCGFGSCMGCSIEVSTAFYPEGFLRVCKEGPVVNREALLW